MLGKAQQEMNMTQVRREYSHQLRAWIDIKSALETENVDIDIYMEDDQGRTSCIGCDTVDKVIRIVKAPMVSYVSMDAMAIVDRTYLNDDCYWFVFADPETNAPIMAIYGYITHWEIN